MQKDPAASLPIGRCEVEGQRDDNRNALLPREDKPCVNAYSTVCFQVVEAFRTALDRVRGMGVISAKLMR